MHTDLPDPVEPAINIWGIFAISATTVFPPISLPTAKDRLEGNDWNSPDSNKSLRGTAAFSLFGTSIPTAAFPGIGASILISVAARFNFMSSARPTILLTFTPCSGCSSYLVTVGPWLISVIVTFTPNVARVFCKCIAVSFNCVEEAAFPLFAPFFKRLNGGNIYFLGADSFDFCISLSISVGAFFSSAVLPPLSGSLASGLVLAFLTALGSFLSSSGISILSVSGFLSSSRPSVRPFAVICIRSYSLAWNPPPLSAFPIAPPPLTALAAPPICTTSPFQSFNIIS